MARDFGNERVVRIDTDSSASEGFPRDLDWVNPSSRHGTGVALVKTTGSGNLGDVGIKDPAEKGMKRITVKLHFCEKTRPQNGYMRPPVRVAPPRQKRLPGEGLR